MKKYLVLLSVSTLMSAEIVQAQENNVIEAPTPTVETAPAVTPKVEATPLVLTPTPTTETAPTEAPTPTEPTPVTPTTGTAPTEAPKKTGTYQAPASQPKNTKTVSTETPKSAEYTNGELPTTGAISTTPWSILGVFSLLTSLLVFKKKYN
jgi:LPXTG-motif cell wall-anchored protein